MENVKDIERIVKDGILVDVNGQSYSAANLTQVTDQRRIAPLSVNTLTGFVDFIESKSEDVSKHLIIIDDYNLVSLLSPINDETRRRDNLIYAKLRKENEFPFNQYLEHEDFMIKLNSLMVENSDRIDLCKFISTLSINNSIETQDDGVSQSATIKRGMSGALKGTAQAPSVLRLCPYRTFRELLQPSSAFLFRMKAIEGKVPVCALFEADGGEWKNDAIRNIKDFFKGESLELTIIS